MFFHFLVIWKFSRYFIFRDNHSSNRESHSDDSPESQWIIRWWVTSHGHHLIKIRIEILEKYRKEKLQTRKKLREKCIDRGNRLE